MLPKIRKLEKLSLELYLRSSIGNCGAHTFLLMLRLGSSGEDVPAPEPLRDFARTFFDLSKSVFSGVAEDEELWEPLEQLWRDFNQGKVCTRSSELRWCMTMGLPRKPVRRPPPLLFETYDEEEDSQRHCGWGCGGKCVQPRSRCQEIIRGWRPPPRYMPLDRPSNPDCSCDMPDMGNSESGCWNLFDLVDRLVHEDDYLSIPVHNLGWNLRKALQRQGMKAEVIEEVIDEAYSRASKVPRPDYEVLDGSTMYPVRVREARRLIQGLHSSPFLRTLLLSRPPKSTLPLHYSLADAAAHARLWLLRSDLPVYLEDRSLTYAVICTSSEPKNASDLLIKERGPSLLELRLRSNTLYLFMQPRAVQGLTNIRVANMRPEEFKVPEQLFRKNERLWEALIRLPHPVVVCAEGAEYTPYPGHPVRGVAFNYIHLLDAERRETRRWLFPRGKPKLPDILTVQGFNDFYSGVFEAIRGDQVGRCTVRQEVAVEPLQDVQKQQRLVPAWFPSPAQQCNQ